MRKNLAAATKAAGKRVAAAADNGPDAGAIAGAQHDAITEVSGLFDGADAIVGDLDTTLNAAIDGRDSLVAAIGALSADDQQDYVDVLQRIDGDVTDEIDGIDEALSDATLTNEAKDALTAARAKLVATQTASPRRASCRGSTRRTRRRPTGLTAARVATAMPCSAPRPCTPSPPSIAPPRPRLRGPRQRGASRRPRAPSPRRRPRPASTGSPRPSSHPCTRSADARGRAHEADDGG